MGLRSCRPSDPPAQDRNTGSGPQPSATPAWSTGQQQQPRQELPRPSPGQWGRDLPLNKTSGHSRTWSRSRSPGPGHFSPGSADPSTSREAAAGDGRGRGSRGRQRWGMLAVTALQEGSAWGESMPAGKHLCMVPSPRNNCLGLAALLTPFCGWGHGGWGQVVTCLRAGSGRVQPGPRRPGDRATDQRPQEPGGGSADPPARAPDAGTLIKPGRPLPASLPPGGITGAVGRGRQGSCWGGGGGLR